MHAEVLTRALARSVPGQTPTAESLPESHAWLHPLAFAAVVICIAMMACVRSPVAEAEHVPEMFVCPIGCAIMRDPVFTPAGNTYERELIANWLRTHYTDPLTNEVMRSKTLTPNFAMRSAIATWTEKQGFPEGFPEGCPVFEEPRPSSSDPSADNATVAAGLGSV